MSTFVQGNSVGFCRECAQPREHHFRSPVDGVLYCQSETVAEGPAGALAEQVGGEHYKEGGIQPVQYIEANKLPFLEGCVVKRVTRHARNGGKGKQDIEKAIHELRLLLQLRYGESRS